MEMTIQQIHNVLRTYVRFLTSKKAESVLNDPATFSSRDRVTISSEAKRRSETVSKSEE